MKFKFSFETLLEQRERTEETARKNLLEAQSVVDSSLDKIKTFWSEIDDSRKDRINKQIAGGRDVHLLSYIDEFICGNKLKIQREKDELRTYMLVLEDKKEILIEAAKEHKVLVKLKERKIKKFKKEKRKKELLEIDDIVTMTYKRSTI